MSLGFKGLGLGFEGLGFEGDRARLQNAYLNGRPAPKTLDPKPCCVGQFQATSSDFNLNGGLGHSTKMALHWQLGSF